MNEPQLCPGPHDPGQEPETTEPLCDDCQRALDQALTDLPMLAVRLHLAIEPGSRPRRANVGDRGHKGDDGHAPLPVDGEADVMMRRVFDILGCWAEHVREVKQLSSEPPKRSVHNLRVTTRIREVVRKSTYPPLPDETERGEIVELERRRVVEAVDRPNDATWGLLIAEHCTTLRRHLDTLIRLERTPVMRRRQIAELAALPDEAIGSLIVTGEGECTHLIDLDGVDAAKEILDLRRACRRFLGDTRGLRQLPVPCPDVDCGGALVVWDGTEHVECVACRRMWSQDDYERLVLVLAHEARREGAWKAANLDGQLVTQAKAAELAGVEAATVRSWVARKLLTEAGRDGYGRPTFRLADVLAVEEKTRLSPDGRKRRP